MKIFTYSFLLIIAILFTSCGNNTETAVVADIASVQIDDTNVSIYSTDAPKELTATVTYTDATSAQIENADLWTNSNFYVLSMYNGTISARTNGGSSLVGINIGRFNDEINVSIIKITDFNITNTDINTTGEHPLEATGLFEDNATKVIARNILWDANNSAIFTTDENYITTITVVSGDTNVSATVFSDDNETTITKSIVYSID